MNRKPDIDWLRGLAVMLMIVWHAIDSWTVLDGRANLAFLFVVFLGGWAAPLFLFLAGVSIPFAGGSRMRRGLSRAEASWLVQKRGWEIFVLAHVFRFQSFVLNPSAEWNSLLKPDILNVLGLAIVAAAYLWGRAESMKEARALLLGPAAVAVAIITPWAPDWSWPARLYPRFEAYLRPAGDAGVFSLFPSAGYVLAGAFLGMLLVEARTPERDLELHRRMGVAGMAATIVGGVLTCVPLTWLADPWMAAPAEFVFRGGAMTLALALTWVWFRHRTIHRQAPMLVFGRTSLFVYWVHVELAYGIVSYPLHHALRLPVALLAYVGLSAAMYGLAVVWERRMATPLIPAHMSSRSGRHVAGIGAI